MKLPIDTGLLSGRVLVLACVILLPFLRFLVRNDYRLWAPESLAAASVLLVVCVALSALARERIVFLCLVALCSVLMATVPALRLLAGVVELTLEQTALVLGVALALLIALLRENFAMLVAVFTLSAFAVDLGQALMEELRRSPPAVRGASTGPLPHVLYLILDEHIGVNGFPEAFAACGNARRKVEQTFAKWGFRTYPNAYSNYPSTVSSLSSVLNRRLLERRRTLLDENSQEWRWGTRTLRQNRLLETFSRRGYRVEVFQHRAMNHVADGLKADAVHEYWDALNALDQAPGSRLWRFRWLIGNYQQSDLVMSRVRAFFPFRFAPHTTGPLSAAAVWPAKLFDQMMRASRKAIFFAHVFLPHFPYLYRKDGSVRDLEEWSRDRIDQRANESLYRERYQRYCEQAEFLSGQLDRLFARMDQAGFFDSTRIVVHGDHGSRIRRSLGPGTRGEQPTGSDPEGYDYRSAPPLRDLLDRFSTLLAVKAPGADQPETVRGRGSLLRFLSEALPLDGQPDPGPDTDFVYLFEHGDRPRRIPILDYWKEKDGQYGHPN